MFKRFLLGLSLLIGLSGTAAAAGGSEQIYFVAQVAPVGSLSSPGQQQQGVYLRWDVLEGALPPELQRFQLERIDGVNGADSEILLDVTANEMMNDAEIAALYQGPAQQRRLLESLAWLQEQASTEQPPVAITRANFAQQIRDRAQDPLWSTLASRVDFNIARARYRGYLDLDAGSGQRTYRLYAVNRDNARVLIGQAVVDPSQPTSVSPAYDFRQIFQAQCDAPEAAKDHGVVALTWNHGGDNQTDRFANSLLIAGYDLYREEHPPQGSPITNSIKQLAAAHGHDQTGTPQLPGLVRVNQQPVMISGRPDNDPDFVQTLETLEDTAAAGLKPGDQRVYHLVPRDMTGNYGPSISYLVTVPDLRQPPAPWSVEVETDDADNKLKLVWDAVNLINYYRTHNDGRQFCNLDSARADKALRYVPKGKVCGVDTEMEVRLDIESYRVYRFDSYEAAARFKDSDGDGYSDRDERAAGPAYACDPNLKPSGAKSALLASGNFETRQLSSDRQQVVFSDPYPAQNKGEVVWYRIAAVNSSNLGSILSAPIRGHFPDRQLPYPPELGKEIKLTTTVSDKKSCGYTIRANEKNERPMFLDSTGDARYVGLAGVCRDPRGRQTLILPLQSSGEGFGVTPTASQCQSLLDSCGPESHAQFTFLDGAGTELTNSPATISYKELHECPAVNMQYELTAEKPCGQQRAVAEGEMLNQPPQLTVSTDQCIAIYREIGGRDYKIDTVCGKQNATVDYGPSTAGQGEMVCLSAATQNENARSSARTRLPCFSVVMPNRAPAAPQPMDLHFSGDQADVVWQLPEERVTATVLELYQPSESARHSVTIPHPGARGGDPRKVAVDITEAPTGTDWQQQWCVRARAIGQATTGDQANVLSEWSAPLCAPRLPAGQVAGKYLPWPELPSPPIREALTAAYLAGDQLPILQVSNRIQSPQNCAFITYGICSINDANNGSCLDKSPPKLYCQPSKDLRHPDPVCSSLRAATAGYLGFVAYRQSRPLGGGEADDFVQVSPLIESNFCSHAGERDRTAGTIDDPYLKLMLFDSDDAQPDLRVIFADRHPHLPGREYRYQFVYFSTDGEIIETRSSQDWLAVPH